MYYTKYNVKIKFIAMKFYVSIFFAFIVSMGVYAQSKSSAMVISEDFVKSVLNYPSTAKFPFGSQTATEESYGKYVILGEVNAKNAFGVQSEMVYKIWLEYKSGDWQNMDSWICEKLILEDRSTRKQSVFHPSKGHASVKSSGKGTEMGVQFLGQNCKVTEQNSSFIRIQTPRKYTKAELQKGLNNFAYKSRIVYFHTAGNSARGKEYASSVNGEIFYY